MIVTWPSEIRVLTMAEAMRIDRGLERGAPFEFQVDGRSVPAFAGESVAAALMAAGRHALRVTAGGESRGYWCGMGVCWDCMMWLEDVGGVRTCQLAAAPGMRLRSMRGAGAG
jgi:D-hydroxyproline dehydrogenase subunit gamma